MITNDVLHTNTLHFRPGETFWIEDLGPPDARRWQEYERGYMVALVDTPAVPYTVEQGVHNKHRNMVVICAEVFSTIESGGEPRIGWVNVGPDEKTIIGELLLSEWAESGEWFLLVLDTRKWEGTPA